MTRYLRHRYALALPFLVLILVTIVGGIFNTVDARGVVIDESTGLPVADVSITYGANRGAVSGPDGRYEIRALPRGARLKTRMPGYLPANPPAEASEIRLIPGTLTVQVNEEGVEPRKGVPNPEFRQGTKVVGKGTDTGNAVITLVDQVELGSKITVCAAGFISTEIDARGVTKVVTMKRGTASDGCPPLPNATPAPGASPSATPSAPPSTAVPSPAPSASGSPKP